MKAMLWIKVKVAAAVVAAATVVASTLAAAVEPQPQTVSSVENAIDRLKPGEWLEVPDSRLKKVAFKWPKGVVFTKNGVGVRGVISTWSGGAYDTKRDRLLVWGGGHFAYAGNETSRGRC